jgi:hypothetical protein
VINCRRNLPVLFRFGIIAVLIEIGGIRESAAALEFDHLRGEGLLGVALAEVVGISQ